MDQRVMDAQRDVVLERWRLHLTEHDYSNRLVFQWGFVFMWCLTQTSILQSFKITFWSGVIQELLVTGIQRLLF